MASLKNTDQQPPEYGETSGPVMVSTTSEPMITTAVFEFWRNDAQRRRFLRTPADLAAGISTRNRQRADPQNKTFFFFDIQRTSMKGWQPSPTHHCPDFRV
jgi:hypothetical protein